MLLGGDRTEMSPVSLLITIVYTILLAWGFYVGARLIWDAYRAPDQLLNPLFSNRWAIRIFVLHIVVVTADLFIVGPLALANKSALWYWGGRIALFSCSLPVATYFNRNPESIGKLIGNWVVLRNFFEYAPAHRGGLDRRQLVQLLCASVVAGCLPLSRCRPEAILPDPLQHAREAGRAALGADLELDGHHGALRAVVPGGLLPTDPLGARSKR